MDIEGAEDIDIGFLTSLNLIATNHDDLCQEISISSENDCKLLSIPVSDHQSFPTEEINNYEQGNSLKANCIVTENQSLPITSVINRIEEELSEEDSSLEKDVISTKSVSCLFWILSCTLYDLIIQRFISHTSHCCHHQLMPNCSSLFFSLEFPFDEEDEEDSSLDSSPLHCSVCKASFARLENLLKHLATRKHFDNITTKNMKAAAKMYSQYHHLLVKQSLYRCACCSFSPVDHNGLVVHLKSQQHRESVSSLTGPAECTVCEFYDYDGNLMLDHFQSAEHVAQAKNGCCIKEKRSNIKCPDCEKVLHSTIQYASHRRKNHPSLVSESQTKLKQCRYCDHKAKPTALAQHYVRFHCNERLYQCTICEIGFNFAYDLRQHRNTVKHVNNVLDTYVDNIRRRLLDSSCLSDSNTNVMEFTNGRDDVSKSMRCKFCRYTTPVLAQLQTHYVTHHEEKYPEEDKTDTPNTGTISVCRFCDTAVPDQELLPHELNHVEV